MPIYVYKCRNCLYIKELCRRMKDSNKPGPKCPGCGKPMPRHRGLEQCATPNKDYDHEILSHRMGVNPDQVSEHRRCFPNIPMTDTGEIVVRNGAEEKRINRELASAFGRR